MRYFWIRFIVFCLLWLFMLNQYNEKLPFSIFMFTLALILFFFLSLKTVSPYIYIGLSLIIMIHSFFIVEFSYSLLLILLITIVSIFKLTEKQLLLYITFNTSAIILLSATLDELRLEGLFLVTMILFLVFTISRLVVVRNEQKDIYDQLLDEHRQLKRINLAQNREARLEERTRIARDIHDSVGHRLTALIMKLEILQIQNPETNYSELKQMANESLEETREAVTTLQVKESEGLPAVVQLIRKLEVESHLLVQFTMKQGVLSVPLSNEKGIVLYRVIQEALTNVMRHSESREVNITLGISAVGSITFEVTNKIFQVETFTSGFGLKNMKKRVQEIGGKLDVYQMEEQFIVSGSIPSE